MNPPPPGRRARNPYCTVKWDMHEVSRTIVAKKTTNPSWNEMDITCVTEPGRSLGSYMLSLEIYDAQPYKDRDDFLGNSPT